jgi:CBS domain-containing protein
MMLVKEVMNTDVKTIEPGDTVLDAARLMTDLSIGCLVVIKDESKLDGIITDSDIIGKVAAQDKKASKVLVRQVMSDKLVVIDQDSDISDAADLMEKSGIKKLPVVSGSSLVGILTVSDLAMAEPKLIKQISALMVMPKNNKNMAG